MHFFRTCINHNHNRLLSDISRMVCYNVNTNTGRNIRNVQLDTEKDPRMFEQIWKLIKYHLLQENELYKIHMIKELTEAKIGAVNLNISRKEIFDILQYLCCY